MPERRMGGEAVSLGDFIYLVGGTGGTTALLRYDPAEEYLDHSARSGAAARACGRDWLSTTSYGLSAGVGAGRARWRLWRYSIRPEELWRDGPALNEVSQRIWRGRGGRRHCRCGWRDSRCATVDRSCQRRGV